MHIQSVPMVLPDVAFELDGQLKQVSDVAAPAVLEYLPIAQSVQASDPAESLYLPATHASHAPPSGPV
jgi:hypothetical protein